MDKEKDKKITTVKKDYKELSKQSKIKLKEALSKFIKDNTPD